MQLKFIDQSQLADLLQDADTLDIIDSGPQRIHVLSYSGADFLAIVDPIAGGAAVVYPDVLFDPESGGSVHDHASHALRGVS